MKDGYKTTEWLALVAALVVAIIPIVLDLLPKEGSVAAILGVLLLVAKYIHDRTALKVIDTQSAAAVATAQAGKPPADPTPG